MSHWETFKDNFKKIIEEHDYYKNIFKFLSEYDNNILLYGAYGFPTDLFIDEVIKQKFDLSMIYKKECIWNKDIVYQYNQHFLEIDLMHPSMCKDLTKLSKFILNVIQNKNINDAKHFIIIKHIDIFNHNDFSSFRIILERFSNNVFFLCTTHKLDKIDVPVKSRFALFRMPQFSHKEILYIFKSYLKCDLNKYLIKSKSRDIIKCIFITELQSHNPQLITEDFCTSHFPPLIQFYKENSKLSLNNIRQISYQCFQYNISISEILTDLLKILPKRKKQKAIAIAADLDHKMNLTNKGREPIYIESLLCQILL